MLVEKDKILLFNFEFKTLHINHLAMNYMII